MITLDQVTQIKLSYCYSVLEDGTVQHSMFSYHTDAVLTFTEINGVIKITNNWTNQSNEYHLNHINWYKLKSVKQEFNLWYAPAGIKR